MKKIAFLLILITVFLNLTSCNLIDGFLGTPNDNSTESGENGSNTPPDPEDNENKTDGPDPDLINVKALRGLNEQIFLSIEENEELSYKVFYKGDSDTDYTELDSNLMISAEGNIDCYLLGIKSGKYDIKIEAENEKGSVAKTYSDITVASQDRSGYAHFGYTEGVGAYNDDGTVKEGTRIIYVNNDNKNTVSLTIDGTEYVGLVNILQAQYKSDVPMLVRIIGKITTNQWNYKNVEPRLSDGSNATGDFFENTFSDEYGENLANLIVKMKGNGGGEKTYNYRTTPEGLSDVRLTNGGTKYTNYKGSDFPSFSGKSVFDDDSYYNMLEVKGSKNITIEGVGQDAELFQFGISFEECSSIEIKNLTFTDYPEDALNFLGGDRSSLASFGRNWVHSCTFNRGYNAWDISGERDKYAGDGSIDFNNVSNLTLAYNYFNNSKKSMLFGSGDAEACMNFTMHHNYFFKVESRLPLGRNVNIHSYNNYFDQCKNCSDIRSSSYLFSENNYFNSTSKPFILSSSAVKSFGDIFVNSSSNGATIVKDRTQSVKVNCKPDKVTNYSEFDMNSDLFYYDKDNEKTDVSIMHEAFDIPEYVSTCAGAGYYGLIDVD
ncbi:MAG: hypothetical protein IJX97_05455 [Clostridia bacterium]|nr:hypothetical protein [Clostridia bacterium]